ncbi:hypothetical protein glysoja_010744 [Glycine soja]|nr:hypothetical protein glysoja_010744 [Glycine soja]
MRNCIRCCISCILPCGALDVIRIVHSNGRVEEIGGTIKASDVMKAHPKHVLKKPCSSAADAAEGGVRSSVGSQRSWWCHPTQSSNVGRFTSSCHSLLLLHKRRTSRGGRRRRRNTEREQGTTPTCPRLCL